MNVHDVGLLRCPDSGAPLEFQGSNLEMQVMDGVLVCPRTGEAWTVDQGVARLYRDLWRTGSDAAVADQLDAIPAWIEPLQAATTLAAGGGRMADLRESVVQALSLGELAGSAEARILEVGVGTAANFEPIQDNSPEGTVIELWGTDLSIGALRRARQRLEDEPGWYGRLSLFMADPHRLPFVDGAFDRVLLDAPCSGEGTVRKDEDAMKNWTQASVLDIADTQKDLIESAFHALKPGGVMVYSTCTLSTEENQQVCHHLKETFGDAVEFESLETLFENANAALTEEGFLHIFPQVYDCEGFFVARIRKLAAVEPPKVKKRMGKFPFTKASKKESVEIAQQLQSALGIELPNDSSVWLRDKDVWLFPNALEPMIGELRFSRMGIKIAEAHKNGYRWQHQVATALATGSEANAIELTIEEAREWYMGRDVRPQTIPEGMKTGKGEVLVTYQGAVIGLGKWVSNRIKNGLPCELVRDKNLF